MVASAPSPSIRRSIQSTGDHKHDALQIAHHLQIGEAQSSETCGSAKVRILVHIYFSIMGITINFDNHAFGRAKEINDPIANNGLHSELVPSQTT